MEPYIGMVVHYAPHTFKVRRCKAAMVLETSGDEVGLVVFTPAVIGQALQFQNNVGHDESCAPGTWHRPEACGSR